MKYVASVSFGKDSLAMLLRLLEENKPIDEVIFYDTGMEFQAIYKIRNKVKVILQENGVELYSILDRVSCWCCANKNLKELKNYYKHLPEYWQKLCVLQTKIDTPFKYGKYTIFDLEKKFKNE